MKHVDKYLFAIKTFTLCNRRLVKVPDLEFVVFSDSHDELLVVAERRFRSEFYRVHSDLVRQLDGCVQSEAESRN